MDDSQVDPEKSDQVKETVRARRHIGQAKKEHDQAHPPRVQNFITTTLF